MGCDREPFTGFSHEPELLFLNDQTSVLATASTFLLRLRLPVSHSNYEDFRRFMIWSFKEHGGIHVV